MGLFLIFLVEASGTYGPQQSVGTSGGPAPPQSPAQEPRGAPVLKWTVNLLRAAGHLANDRGACSQHAWPVPQPGPSSGGLSACGLLGLPGCVEALKRLPWGSWAPEKAPWEAGLSGDPGLSCSVSHKPHPHSQPDPNRFDRDRLFSAVARGVPEDLVGLPEYLRRTSKYLTDSEYTGRPAAWARAAGWVVTTVSS